MNNLGDVVWRGDVRLVVDTIAPEGSWDEGLYTAAYPLHEDYDLSFIFDLVTRSWRCHSGCGDGDLVALGVRLWSCGTDEAAARMLAICGDAREAVQRYAYHEADGAFAFEVVRFLPKDLIAVSRWPGCGRTCLPAVRGCSIGCPRSSGRQR